MHFFYTQHIIQLPEIIPYFPVCTNLQEAEKVQEVAEVAVEEVEMDVDEEIQMEEPEPDEVEMEIDEDEDMEEDKEEEEEVYHPPIKAA